jgi:hypothetical protein
MERRGRTPNLCIRNAPPPSIPLEPRLIHANLFDIFYGDSRSLRIPIP